MKLLLKAALISTCIFFASSSQAKKADFSQPLDVQADSSTFDERTGMQVLEGNVEITQGTMQIKADKISVQLDFGKLSLIKGKGSPILFSQENENDKIVSGRCQEIIYNAQDSTLILIGNAYLNQPNQELSGERIEFDSKTQKVKAQGGKSGRVSIKIQPPKTDEKK